MINKFHVPYSEYGSIFSNVVVGGPVQAMMCKSTSENTTIIIYSSNIVGPLLIAPGPFKLKPYT